jgi:hypothetical protein
MKSDKEEKLDVLSTEELTELVANARNKKIKEWYNLGMRVVVGRNDGYWWNNSSTYNDSDLAQKPSRRKVIEIIKNNPNATEIGFNGTIKVGEKVGQELEIVDDFDVILWEKDSVNFKKGLQFEFAFNNGKYINTIVDKDSTVTYKDRPEDNKYVYFIELDKKYNTISEWRYRKDILKELFDNREAFVIKDGKVGFEKGGATEMATPDYLKMFLGK